MRAMTSILVVTLGLSASLAFAEPQDATAPVTIKISPSLIKALAAQQQQAQTQQQAQVSNPLADNRNEDLVSLFVGIEFNRYNPDQVDYGAFRQFPNNIGFNPGFKFAPFSDEIRQGDNFLITALKRTKFVVEVTINSTYN